MTAGMSMLDDKSKAALNRQKEAETIFGKSRDRLIQALRDTIANYSKACELYARIAST